MPEEKLTVPVPGSSLSRFLNGFPGIVISALIAIAMLLVILYAPDRTITLLGQTMEARTLLLVIGVPLLLAVLKGLGIATAPLEEVIRQLGNTTRDINAPATPLPPVAQHKLRRWLI